MKFLIRKDLYYWFFSFALGSNMVQLNTLLPSVPIKTACICTMEWAKEASLCLLHHSEQEKHWRVSTQDHSTEIQQTALLRIERVGSCLRLCFLLGPVIYKGIYIAYSSVGPRAWKQHLCEASKVRATCCSMRKRCKESTHGFLQKSWHGQKSSNRKPIYFY